MCISLQSHFDLCYNGIKPKKRKNHMEQKKHFGRLFMCTCCGVYLAVMLLLLYSKGVPAHAYRLQNARLNGYLPTVLRYTNLHPLKSIRPFLRKAAQLSLYDKIMNQVTGNVLIFIPAGIFLPYYRAKQRHLKPFCFTVLLIILFVELSQVLSFLGSFDVDDILLNLLGCLIGWLIFKITYGFLHLLHFV